jgi:hypothetical protein
MSASGFAAALLDAQSGRARGPRTGTREFAASPAPVAAAARAGRRSLAAISVLAAAVLGTGAIVAFAAFDWSRDQTSAASSTPTASATPTPRPTRTPLPTPTPTATPEPEEGFFEGWGDDVDGFIDAIDDLIGSLP